MIMRGDSCPKVVSLNPGTVYWMDIISHTYLQCVFEKSIINEKEAGVGQCLKKPHNS